MLQQEKISDVLIGLRSSESISAPRSKELIVKAGGRITKSAFKKMEAAGIKSIPISRDELIERTTLVDIIDPETGEVILESNERITEDVAEKIFSVKISSLQLLFIDGVRYLSSLRDTLVLDKVNSTEEALVEIYKKLRPGEPPSMADAKALFDGLFFNPKRYDLSEVGRLKLNKRLALNVPLDTRVLTDKDIIEILRYLFDLRAGKGEVDDIDHLGNRKSAASWRTPGKPVQNRTGKNGAGNKRKNDPYRT